MNVQEMYETVWNFPPTDLPKRLDAMKLVIDDHLSRLPRGTKIDVLEVGVFFAGTFKALYSHYQAHINSYLGVDPYIGDETDPYFGGYWKKQKSIADETYEKANAAFESHGQKLLRLKSDDFFKQNTRTFDIIFVDGDHRLEPTLKDMSNALDCLRSGGIVFCDDYSNIDHPQVVPAVNEFYKRRSAEIDKVGFKPTFFTKGDIRPLPVHLGLVYFKKK